MEANEVASRKKQSNPAVIRLPYNARPDGGNPVSAEYWTKLRYFTAKHSQFCFVLCNTLVIQTANSDLLVMISSNIAQTK